tara:strand:- start:521 stop:901 length:381 start_codon:yes stop_codon:yes gene_type:complete
MKKTILLTATILGGLSVLIGAMGAHFLEDYLISVDRVDTYETAVKYQFYHVLFLLSLAICLEFSQQNIIKYAFYCCLLGLLFFSGSLYLLCATNNSIFGMITPIGGLLLVMSWLLFFSAVIKSKKI